MSLTDAKVTTVVLYTVFTSFKDTTCDLFVSDSFSLLQDIHSNE